MHHPRFRLRLGALALGVVLSLPLTAAAAQEPATPAVAGTTTVLPERLHGLDAYVEAVRERFDVPGIAVAIVKDGEVLLERGYGVKDLEGGEPVDARTLFAIASNTKAFTSAALSMLADEGKLELEDRVIDHLPWFRMADPYITREMRVRDLLVHRSGLPLGAGDLLYWPTSDYSTREVAERLAEVPIEGGFREKYAYDNILFGVAQLVIEEASGQSYRDFLQQRILDPLGMADTRFNSDHLRSTDNVATGYSKADHDELVAAPRVSWHNVSGAGGMYSSVHDLTRWVRVQLDQGVISGEGEDAERLFSEKRQQAMWQMVTPIPVGKPAVPELEPAQPNFRGYGEGWSLNDYRGEKLVWHTGGWPGFVSRITLVPEHELGVIVLTSAESGAAFNAITNEVLDAYLGAPEHDWIGAYAAARGSQEEKAEKDWQRHLDARDPDSRHSLPLAGYATTYRDPWYGEVVIREAGDGLRINFSRTPDLAGKLEHWQADTFIVRWDQRWLNADAFITFSLDPDNNVREARMEAVSPLTDFSFDFHHLRLAPIEEENP